MMMAHQIICVPKIGLAEAKAPIAKPKAMECGVPADAPCAAKDIWSPAPNLRAARETGADAQKTFVDCDA